MTTVDPLVGREADLARLQDVLGRSRLVTLTGPGGSGKTRLARALLASIVEAGRVAWFVDCAAIENPALVGAAIAAALGLEEPGDGDPPRGVIRSLSAKDQLIVLDNLEQLRDAATVVERLADAVPRLQLVATSRLALGARGELEFDVAPLELPRDASAASVAASPAGQLFLLRSGAQDAGASFDPAAAADIAALLRRLDGLPLAIELAAARARVLTPGELNRRLDAHGPAAIDSPVPDRHRSLGSIIDWTISQLSPPDTEVLEAIAVCAGFDVALVEALVPDRDVIPALESLIALGLVRRMPDVSGRSRFGMLQTIQATVLHRLAPERRAMLQARHASHFLAVAEGWLANASRGATGDMASAYDADADNVRRALDVLQATNPAGHLELLISPFWWTQPRQREGYDRFQQATGTFPTPTRDLVSAAERLFGSANLMLGQTERTALNAWVVDAARTIGDRETLIAALRSTVLLAFNEGNAERSAAAVAELRGLAADGPPVARILLLEAEAWHKSLEEPASDRQVELMREFVAALEAAGDVWRVATNRANLALVLIARGEYEEALHLARTAADSLRTLGRPATYAYALAFIGPCLAELGRTDEAIEAAIETAAASMDTGYGENLAWALWSAIPVALAAGLPELAARLRGCLVEGMHARGETTLTDLDRVLLDRWLQRARAAATEVSIELAIRDGARAHASELIRELPTRLAAPGARTKARQLRHGGLTRREVEILTLVGQGRSDPEIGAALFISPKTASAHVANVKAKLGVETRLQIALKARELGFTDEGG